MRLYNVDANAAALLAALAMTLLLAIERDSTILVLLLMGEEMMVPGWASKMADPRERTLLSLPLLVVGPVCLLVSLIEDLSRLLALGGGDGSVVCCQKCACARVAREGLSVLPR